MWCPVFCSGLYFSLLVPQFLLARASCFLVPLALSLSLIGCSIARDIVLVPDWIDSQDAGGGEKGRAACEKETKFKEKTQR